MTGTLCSPTWWLLGSAAVLISMLGFGFILLRRRRHVAAAVIFLATLAGIGAVFALSALWWFFVTRPTSMVKKNILKEFKDLRETPSKRKD